MSVINRLRFAVSGELAQDTWQYVTGLFFLLVGVSAGITCHIRAGISLGAGAPMSFLSAVVVSTLPFAFMLIASPFFVGIVGICAVMVWQGLLLGCGPVMPLGLLQISLGVPTALFMFKKGFGLSLKWCKIKRATPAMRVAAVTELFPPAFVCVVIQLVSRIPACAMGG